jgi:uncharacterized membrane protein YqjE
MNGDAPNAGGWMNSLRRTGDSLLGLVQSRFELFVVELQEEKLRALNLVVWFVVALTGIVAGMLVGLIALAIGLWHLAGVWGFAGLAVALLAAACTILWRIHHHVRHGPMPFAETIGEFRKDRACLRQNN